MNVFVMCPPFGCAYNSTAAAQPVYRYHVKPGTLLDTGVVPVHPLYRAHAAMLLRVNGTTKSAVPCSVMMGVGT